jgi:exonuclease III
MDKFTCITYNAKGLKDPKKREGVFYWLKKKKVDLICIQEAHCEEQHMKTWEEEWGGNIYASYGTGGSKGVCIMIGEGSNLSTELIATDKEGRYVIIKAKLGEHSIKIGGYYGPNKDDPTTLNIIQEILDETMAEHTILMGDFNFTMDVTIDKKGGTNNNHTKCRNSLVDWMEENDLCEVWRARNPEKRMYTWRSNTKPPIFCRLDFFIVSPSISNGCNICTIGPGVRSDHSYVKLGITLESPARGRGFWKFDHTLLENEDFKKELITRMKQTEEDNPDTEPTLLWETIKCTIRGECISYSNRRRKKMDHTIQELEREIINMEQKTSKEEEQQKHVDNVGKSVEELRSQLEQHVETKGRWAAAKSKNILYELGEKPNKFIMQQNKERGANKVIRRLVKDNGEEITKQQEIMKEQEEFYRKIYKSSLKNSAAEEDDFGNIIQEIEELETPMIDNSKWEDMTKDITEDEIWKVILSCADNKSPGTDGLNNNFYKAMWPYVKKYLISSFKSTLQRGELSISQKQGIISLIPKPNKDSTKLKNWRPITLLNQDYKYLAKCLANRCKKTLPDIISPDQTGFVPGRLIGTNILKAQSIISYMEEHNEEGLMMGIDYEKAFDTIEWSFIKKSLEHFNFPPTIINWITTLYNNINTRIINNGHTSKPFNPTRGVRQGCPLSPILFVIAVELIAEKIRANSSIKGITVNGKEIKVSQFADDTTFYIQPDKKSIEETFETLTKFSRITGLKINKEKTEILILGRTDINKLESNLQQYVKNMVKMLGVSIGKDKYRVIQENFDPIYEKIQNSLKFWKSKGLSIQGRITILKTMVVPKLIYALNVLPTPPPGKIKEIEDSFYKFIWKDKPDKVKRDTIIADYRDGGLKMPDISSQNISLKTLWIHRLSEKEGNWSSYIKEKLPLNNLEYFKNCSINFCDIPKKPHKDSFWSEAMLQWCILNQEHTNKKDWTIEEIKKENIWWNSNIKIGKKVIEYKKWANSGILQINHLLKDNGEWLTHQELERKYKIKIPFTQLYGIQTAIKTKWGDIIDKGTSGKKKKGRKLIDKLKGKKKGSQTIYWILVGKKMVPPTTRRKKWERDIGEEIEVQVWRRHLVKMRQLNESSKMKSWTYMYLMRLTPYNTRLKIMGKAETELCTFCKKWPETLKHLYWSCEHTKNLWRYIENTFDVKLSIKQGLLGLDDIGKRKDKGLKMYMHLTRYYTHLCKCNGTLPKIKGLQRVIDRYHEADLGVATRNNNYNKFRERWGTEKIE